MADFIKIGKQWIPKLWDSLWKVRKKRVEELNRINEIVLADPIEVAKYYVEPECQDRNPADRWEDDSLLSKTPVMKTMNEFFKTDRIRTTGGNMMFILSDAGMGKTALLTMLKLLHLMSFLPKQTDCVLMKLGESTIEDIKKIENKRKTILLLDSLDEDQLAYGRVKDRLLEILQAAQPFFRVVITCRTQFFPEGEKDPMDRLGMFCVGGYSCQVKFLSWFSDEKVTGYLERRIPRRFFFFRDNKKLAKARTVVEKMGSLQCRPMLLAYIEDLMASPLPEDESSEYKIYNALVENWLRREQTKKPAVDVDQLRKACIILAVWLQEQGERSISEADLDELIRQTPDVKSILSIDIKGRSLLNRDSKGRYRFSHYSVQEFLVAKLLLDEPVYQPKGKIAVTDFIFRMLRVCQTECHYLDALDFAGIEVAIEGLTLPLVLRLLISGAGLSGFHSSIDHLNMDFVYIAPGFFNMGSDKGDDDEKPVHEVQFATGFFMQTTPVTQAQWEKVMGDNPSHFQKAGPNAPVENVSWNDAKNFIEKLNKQEKTDQYCLPTEAQWEYACRAGSTTEYYFGDDEKELKEYAWFDGNSGKTTRPVKEKKPNALGLYDMHGNVWEWCEDQWHDNYKGAPADGSARVDQGKGAARVIRGGAWYGPAGDCRSASRDSRSPDYRYQDGGFRLVRLPGQVSSG